MDDVLVLVLVLLVDVLELVLVLVLLVDVLELVLVLVLVVDVLVLLLVLVLVVDVVVTAKKFSTNMTYSVQIYEAYRLLTCL